VAPADKSAGPQRARKRCSFSIVLRQCLSYQESVSVSLSLDHDHESSTNVAGRAGLFVHRERRGRSCANGGRHDAAHGLPARRDGSCCHSPPTWPRRPARQQLPRSFAGFLAAGTRTDSQVGANQGQRRPSPAADGSAGVGSFVHTAGLPEDGGQSHCRRPGTEDLPGAFAESRKARCLDVVLWRTGGCGQHALEAAFTRAGLHSCWRACIPLLAPNECNSTGAAREQRGNDAVPAAADRTATACHDAEAPDWKTRGPP